MAKSMIDARYLYLISSVVLAPTMVCCDGVRAAESLAVQAKHDMVVSADVDASRAGLEVLQRGGNAVDAAVAVAFALAVVRPDSGNLGGGGFMMVHLKSGQDLAVDFRETAPLRSSGNMYLDRAGHIIRGASTIGYQSVAVPGTVAGMALAHRRWGRLSWQSDLEPACRLASRGFRISRALADELADPETQALLRRFPESRRLFLANSRSPRLGDVMVRPDLAATIRDLQTHGPRAFYRGRIATTIAHDMRLHGGLISLRDLNTYQPVVRDPITGQYRGYQVVSMPPPSSGGVALLEMLNILQRYDLASSGPDSALTIHRMAEAMRRAFADRSRYLGDPDFVKVPVSRLISPDYANIRAASVLPDRASTSTEVGPGAAAKGSPLVPTLGYRRGISADSRRWPAFHEKTETTHFSIVDRWGNAAACTYTLNGAFGSGITVPGTGIVLNDEMDDFASAPGIPNMFGLLQGAANEIAPRKRPLSSMTPTFVFRNGRLVLVTGSPGGLTIINTVLNILVNTIDFHLGPSAAVRAPRFHHQWLPDRLRVERGGLSPETLQRLRVMGYTVEERGPMGDAGTIGVDPRTGARIGAADPRGSGEAVGD